MKRILPMLASLLFIALVHAEEPAPAFVLTTADGDTLRGPLQEMKADWSLRVGDKTLAANEVVSLRRANGKLPPFPTEKHVILANGDRIPVEGPHLVGEKLHFKNPDLDDGNEVSVSLSAVVVLWLTTPDNVEHADQLRRGLATASRTRDRVLLRNGDALEGLFNALDSKHVEVEQDKKTLEVKTDEVSAIALSTDSLDKLTPKGIYVHLVLIGDDRTNGTRLKLSEATCKDGVTLRGKTVFGAQVRVPLSRIASLDWMQGAAAYLSDLKPTQFEHTSFLGDDGVPWPLVTDAAVTSRDLRVGGSVFDKGLGMHTRSRATYMLDGKYRRFQAVVGLDEETGRDGSARIRVFGDGKPLDIGKDVDVTATTGPLVINLRIEGVKELTLEADFGKRGDVQGHVNWGDARLLK